MKKEVKEKEKGRKTLIEKNVRYHTRDLATAVAVPYIVHHIPQFYNINVCGCLKYALKHRWPMSENVYIVKASMSNC